MESRETGGDEGRKINHQESGAITSRLCCETASRLMRDDCCVAAILRGRDSQGVEE